MINKICPRCHGLLLPLATVTAQGVLDWWQCVNCAYCVDTQAERNRREGVLAHVCTQHTTNGG